MKTIIDLARLTRNHYMRLLMAEFYLQQHRASRRNLNRENEVQWSVLTDYDSSCSSPKPLDTLHNPKPVKLYRDDISIVKGNEIIEHVMCWPMVPSNDEEYKTEDFACYQPYKGIIGQTRIEINPFPWFNCEVCFYSSAEAVMGLIDLWFIKWYKPDKKGGTFLNVVHSITGPYREKTGEDVYYFDFGTAHETAFTDLLMHICRPGVEKIVIK